MKKILLSLAIAVASQVGAFAQTAYTFSRSTGTYADLTGSTVVSTAGWTPNSPNFAIPIGFSFVLDGQTFTTLEADGFGDLSFSSATADKAIFPFDGILVDRSFPSTTATLSPVSYLLTGTAGSRILKIEFKNAGTADPVAGTLFPNDFVNFQVWLYEGSNKIEIRYGTSNLTHATDTFFGELGPSEAIVTGGSSSTISGYFLQGTAAAPTMTFLNNAATYSGLTTIPANGTIYTFSVSGVSGVSKDLNNASVAVYPNPVTDELRIEGFADAKNKVTVNVYDVMGKVVLTQELNAAATMPVNVSKLTKGTYFLEILSGSNRAGKQVIKL